MTAADRLHHWNVWYDGLPQEWRFQVVLWPLVVIGALNMLLTISVGFPFALLVLLAMACLAAIRAPYVLGWIAPSAAAPTGAPGDRRFEIGNADWLVNLNRRYDALPEFRGLWLVTAILVVAGAINMLLTINTGFPFGLIFLLAFLALAALRGPYAAGVLKAPLHTDPTGAAVRYDPGRGQLPAPTIQALTLGPQREATPTIDAAEAAPRRAHDAEVSAASSPAAGAAAPTHAPGEDDDHHRSGD